MDSIVFVDTLAAAHSIAGVVLTYACILAQGQSASIYSCFAFDVTQNFGQLTE